MKHVFSLLLIYLTILLAQTATAQVLGSPMGAAAWSTGGTSVAQSDIWSTVNNPAALTQANIPQIGVYTDQRFNLKQLRTAAVAGIYHHRLVSLGAHIIQHGFELFNQQRIGVSFGRKLTENLSLGLSMDYLATNISEFGSSGSFAASVGVQYKLTEQLTAGFMVFNPTQSKISNLLADPIPTLGRLGITYNVSAKVKLLAETEQSLQSSLIWRGGIRYALNDVLDLSMGGATQPNFLTAGFHIKLNKLNVSFASSFHEVMGFTPHVSLVYSLRKK